MKRKPEYSIVNDDLKFWGTFESSNRNLRKIANFLMQLNTIKYFGVEFPRLYSDQNYKLLFKMLDDSISKLQTKSVKKLLIVYQSDISDQIRLKAQENGFDVLDFEEILSYRSASTDLKINADLGPDPHPSPEAYWLLSALVKNKINKM